MRLGNFEVDHARGHELPKLLFRHARIPQDHRCPHILPQCAVRQGEDHRLGHRRVLQQDLFHLARRDLFAPAIDDFLDAPLDEKVAVGVEAAQIARAEPSVREGLGRPPDGRNRA